MLCRLIFTFQYLIRDHVGGRTPTVIFLDIVSGIYTVVQKNKTRNYCPYLCQILTDFQNSFTGTLTRKFAIKISLQIPPHINGVDKLPCEILVYKDRVD